MPVNVFCSAMKFAVTCFTLQQMKCFVCVCVLGCLFIYFFGGCVCFRYSLFSAVSTISPESINPHLTAITTLMVLSLKSTEGVTVSASVPSGNSSPKKRWICYSKSDRLSLRIQGFWNFKYQPIVLFFSFSFFNNKFFYFFWWGREHCIQIGSQIGSNLPVDFKENTTPKWIKIIKKENKKRNCETERNTQTKPECYMRERERDREVVCERYRKHPVKMHERETRVKITAEVPEPCTFANYFPGLNIIVSLLTDSSRGGQAVCSLGWWWWWWRRWWCCIGGRWREWGGGCCWVCVLFLFCLLQFLSLVLREHSDFKARFPSL